jgi:chemosensory pili system protein ChpA (sensor histidine kinase/response regulator)
MPRLDGFGFLAHVKAKDNLRSLPVMMLTSRSGGKYQEIAFKLGASAYFSKPFQEEELLKTVRRLISPALAPLV